MRVELSFLACGCLLSPLYGVCAFVPATSFVRQTTLTSSPIVSVLYYSDGENLVLDKSAPKKLGVHEPWKKILDFNQDGKVDAQDLDFLVNNAFDVNRDGKVDEKDAQAAFSMMILSWAIMASPANAKGGGGGGGGGGGHSSSSAAPSYAPYRRPNKRTANQRSTTYRPTDPMACSNLPIQGELLDVLVDNRRGTYVPGVVTTTKENTCRFQADLLGEGELARYRGFKGLSSHRNFLDWIFPTFIFTSAGASVSAKMADQKWEDDFDDAFFGDAANLASKVTVLTPSSGQYVGSTSESDGMNQDVTTNLEFDEVGGIHGSGIDSFDGAYKIVGTWNNRKVRWTEHYAGFETTVRGNIDRNGTIKCRFKSSRGVRGRFEIAKKRTWKKW